MKIGLVLSGGGMRGVAHIGAIKALEEHNIFPSYIAGTSAGAVVGALYANGCSWQHMLELFKTVDLFSVKKYARNKPGFVDASKYYDLLRTYLPHDNFTSLKIPLYITATNLLDGSLKVFHQGELIRPVLASAAVPGFFAPVQIEDGYYIDGGTLNTFPVELISHFCDQIVGVYVNPFKKVRMEHLKHSYHILERAYHIILANESLSKFEDCNLLIQPKGLENYNMFAVKNIDTIFQLGYESAMEEIRSNPSFILTMTSSVRD
ncbi:NTE family protein [Maribacter sedimenticola]|uniref:NTE family protein n=1 Tax=Maribacter sedimenticola TaxID=228956 RepID=A0ABY1SF77_9FLAO|nr:patatin-like phospholipase family protein [Maribacter sedimenticola]SNR39727.1 NTE family protein [Maribacter sedimenticola]